MKKSRAMLCGAACIHYIFSLDKKALEVPPKLMWITDLALQLSMNGYDIELACHKSKLLTDSHIYTKSNFEGFLSVRRFEESGKIIDREFTIKSFRDDFVDYRFCIICVSSGLFNNDEQMVGNHYIVVCDIKGDVCEIVNPRVSDYEIKSMPIKDLIKCSRQCGEWRLYIK